MKSALQWALELWPKRNYNIHTHKDLIKCIQRDALQSALQTVKEVEGKTNNVSPSIQLLIATIEQ